MATKKKRITISLNDETYNALKRMSIANKEPMSSIVSSYLESITPVFEELADTFEAILNTPKESLELLKKKAEKDSKKLNELLENVLEITDEYRAENVNKYDGS